MEDLRCRLGKDVKKSLQSAGNVAAKPDRHVDDEKRVENPHVFAFEEGENDSCKAADRCDLCRGRLSFKLLHHLVLGADCCCAGSRKSSCVHHNCFLLYDLVFLRLFAVNKRVYLDCRTGLSGQFCFCLSERGVGPDKREEECCYQEQHDSEVCGYEICREDRHVEAGLCCSGENVRKPFSSAGDVAPYADYEGCADQPAEDLLVTSCKTEGSDDRQAADSGNSCCDRLSLQLSCHFVVVVIIVCCAEIRSSVVHHTIFSFMILSIYVCHSVVFL